jgi:hypothetical protein
MKTVQVREVKNKTSQLLRQAATKDVIGDYADEGYRKRALRILATFNKAKPDKGKKWIAQGDHDRVLYGGLEE